MTHLCPACCAHSCCRCCFAAERGTSRAVAVTDYVSSCVIRSAPEGNGAEMESVYFEDSGVSGGVLRG